MDLVEDMLFSTQDSHDAVDDLWQEDIDDKQMLKIAGDECTNNGDLVDTHLEVTAELLNTELLASADTTITIPDDMLMEAIDTCSMSNTVLLLDVSKELPRDRHWVIARLEDMLESIIDGLLEGCEKLTFALKSRAYISRRQSITKSAPGTTPAPRVRQISFPGSTAQEAWNFTVLLRIVELIHGGLVDNTIMTKRDLYYRHPDLFVKQAVVDRYVDDLACTLGVSRSQLNVAAAAKGLVTGPFVIRREDSTQVDGTNDKEGMLVPKIGDTDAVDLTRIRWILIIEKEATFRSLISAPQWAKLSKASLALTAKGYPDLGTRAFLRHLNDRAPYLPMYVFVDLDPDGIAIMSTYKYGSFRLAHEDIAPTDTRALSLPNIRWLGLKRHHISQLPTDDHDANTSIIAKLQGLMKLTIRDRTKAIRMLQWDLCSEAGPEQEWRHELQTMLMLNVKAEMQILDESPGGMVSFLCLELGEMEEAEVNVVVETTCSEDGLLF